MSAVSVLLCGDVMTGRGIDQVLRHPGDPALREAWIRDARDYVALAERTHGPIGRRLPPEALWGEALEAIHALAPDLRLVNLETAITARGTPLPGKEIHYRMHPANGEVLRAFGIDACALANNHLLDFGREGLLDTLAFLDEAGIAHAGAGVDRASAEAPAALPLPDGGRLLFFSVGDRSSGIPSDWAATADRPGVALLPDLREETARALAARVAAAKRPGDRAVVSIHAGSNWGWGVPPEAVQFARALVDGGVDLVHGHSSHHPRPFEIRNGRLVLWGCGDFLDDYEGISGYEEYGSDRVLAWIAALDEEGRCVDLRALPFRIHRFRLRRASAEEARWLLERLQRACLPFGTRLRLDEAGAIRI